MSVLLLLFIFVKSSIILPCTNLNHLIELCMHVFFVVWGMITKIDGLGDGFKLSGSLRGEREVSVAFP